MMTTVASARLMKNKTRELRKQLGFLKEEEPDIGPADIGALRLLADHFEAQADRLEQQGDGNGEFYRADAALVRRAVDFIQFHSQH